MWLFLFTESRWLNHSCLLQGVYFPPSAFPGWEFSVSMENSIKRQASWELPTWNQAWSDHTRTNLGRLAFSSQVPWKWVEEIDYYWKKVSCSKTKFKDSAFQLAKLWYIWFAKSEKKSSAGRVLTTSQTSSLILSHQHELLQRAQLLNGLFEKINNTLDCV